ncbi:MAG: phenylalanine--tRNA ligase subunit beta [Chloroflexota bacterium]|nr:MAG: phenylalanine--tRNA ligase subunit beta [Chloroflexota bacterium]
MLVPLSWLKDFVDIDIPVELLAEKLTLAGLEVAHLTYLGVPQQQVEGVRWPQSDHLVWDREKLLWARITEVKPHPDADRLVLAMVDYGGPELEQCVTGAPNLFDYKGRGPLEEPLYTAFAAEGAEVWDGHSDTPKRMILKERKLRGIPNRSMVCSEKELGISDSHEGIILMHSDFGHPPGTPLQDVLGDVIIEVEFTPNLARAMSILGVAREVAALLDKPLREPSYDVLMQGASIEGQVAIDIREPELNPRFTLALLRNTRIGPSPDWMRWRLERIGQRPINNIVDVTNYVMFETGQPLHAFDYDKLVARAGGKAPTIITRLPEPGETLKTLDGVERKLDAHNILVADTAGALSLGGIMGGEETEISDETTNVLLEAAAWNFINIRRTMQSQKIHTEAAARFSRGVHPSRALLGVRRGIELMRQLGGGEVAQGIIDAYPRPQETVVVDLPAREIRRLLGIELDIDTAAGLLRRLQFGVEREGDTLRVTVPDFRLDIGTGIVGQADMIEEIARVYGYNNLPTTIIADALPPQRPNPDLEYEEKTRDLLVGLGLRENISYRLTTPEREALLTPPGMPSSLPNAGYVRLANPISPDKTVMRHTLLVNLLENARANARYTDRQQVFEIGSVYLGRDDDPLPDEPRHLGILMTGPRQSSNWATQTDPGNVDFYDIKGVIEALLNGLHIRNASFERASHSTFHPGRSASLRIGKREVGVFGELHPQVARAFELTDAPVMVAEIDLDALLSRIEPLFSVQPLPVTPPVLQDIALIVNAETPAAAVEKVIRKAGGELLKHVQLFDVYQGSPIPEGHKSLAYSLTYQTDERTLTDKEVARVHAKIVKAAERELGAKLRDGSN